jgi:hypothetical protein
MTQSSRWKTVQCEAAYYAFKDEVRRMNVTLPEKGYHVLFVRKMPKSWSDAKKDRMRHKGLQVIPDKDNLEKALMDAIFKNDSHIWDGRVSKVWGDDGKVIIITGIKTDWIKHFLDDELCK